MFPGPSEKNTQLIEVGGDSADADFGLRQNWLSIVRLLDKQKTLILASWLALTLLAGVLIWRWPPTYKAETLIMVESQKIPEKLVSATVNAELQDRVATLTNQILSAGRLEDLIKRFNLYPEDRTRFTTEELLAEMRSDVSIKVERGWTRNQPGAVRVAYYGPTPEITAAVANEIGEFFVDENSKSRESQAQGTSAFLESQLGEAKKQLELHDQRLSSYKLRHSGSLPEQREALMATLQRLQMELQGTQDAISRNQQQKVLSENAISSATATLAGLNRSLEDVMTTPEVVVVAAPRGEGPTARKRSEILEDQLEVLRRRYRETHPDVEAMKLELDQARQSEARDAERAARAAREEKERLARGEKPARRPPADLTQSILREKERVSGLRAQLEVIDKDLQQQEVSRRQVLAEIAAYQQRLETLPVREQEMSGLTRDYEMTKKNYESLLEKNMAASMASDMEKRQKAERFVMIDRARLPEKPERPKRGLLTAAACILALGLAIAAGVAREYAGNVVLGDWEIPENVTVLGRIPPIQLEAGRGGRPGEL